MSSDFGFAVTLAWYAVGLIVGTIVHEAAHSLTAAVLDCDPRLVSIGRGPILARFRIGPVWIVARALPVTGYSARLPTPRTRRVAMACIVAAGPAATFILLGASGIALAAAIIASADDPTAMAMGVFVAQAVILLGSLSPRTTRYQRGAALNPTDGLKLVRFFRGADPDEFTNLYATLLRLTPETPLPAPSLAAREMLYQLTRRDRFDDWAQTDAARVLTRLLNSGDLTEVEHTFLLNWLDLREPTVGTSAPAD